MPHSNRVERVTFIDRNLILSHPLIFNPRHPHHHAFAIEHRPLQPIRQQACIVSIRVFSDIPMRRRLISGSLGSDDQPRDDGCGWPHGHDDSSK